MLLEYIAHIHTKVKRDWRLLAVVSYLWVAILTTILHIFRPGENGVSLDGIMSTLAGILTSIVATTFSFVFVALQLASVQFSPRIIRNFFEYDNFSKFFLWSFLACVFYLLFLQYFGFSDSSYIYPKFGIIGAFYLLIIVFPLFIHHIIAAINASSITANIAKRTILEMQTLYDYDELKRISSDGFMICSKNTGYLESIDFIKLYAVIPENNETKISITLNVGSFVTKGFPMAIAHCAIEDNQKWDALSEQIEKCFAVSKFRSYTQDVVFGIRQLVDIAIKAISPAVNDPTTAMNSIDYLGQILQQACISDVHSKGAKLLLKKNVHVKEYNFEHLVDFMFDQIYQWGRSDYQIVRHLIKTITKSIPVVYNADKLKVLICEVEDMELLVLTEKNENGNFNRKEHRNSIRFHLAEFYKAVVIQINSLPKEDDVLHKSIAKYEEAMQKLIESKEV